MKSWANDAFNFHWTGNDSQDCYDVHRLRDIQYRIEAKIASLQFGRPDIVIPLTVDEAFSARLKHTFPAKDIVDKSGVDEVYRQWQAEENIKLEAHEEKRQARMRRVVRVNTADLAKETGTVGESGPTEDLVRSGAKAKDQITEMEDGNQSLVEPSKHTISSNGNIQRQGDTQASAGEKNACDITTRKRKAGSLGFDCVGVVVGDTAAVVTDGQEPLAKKARRQHAETTTTQPLEPQRVKGQNRFVGPFLTLNISRHKYYRWAKSSKSKLFRRQLICVASGSGMYLCQTIDWHPKIVQPPLGVTQALWCGDIEKWEWMVPSDFDYED